MLRVWATRLMLRVWLSGPVGAFVPMYTVAAPLRALWLLRLLPEDNEVQPSAIRDEPLDDITYAVAAPVRHKESAGEQLQL